MSEFRYFSPLKLTSTCIDRICVFLPPKKHRKKTSSKHPFQPILEIALYTVCVLSSSSMSFLSFDYGRLFSIFCMNLDQFTCCRNVPSVRNVFWGKNKTALGLSGRNLKTSPVKKSRSKTVHLVVNTCVSMTNPRKYLWLVIIGARKYGDFSAKVRHSQHRNFSAPW